jgi:hypothetical protein
VIGAQPELAAYGIMERPATEDALWLIWQTVDRKTLTVIFMLIRVVLTDTDGVRSG